MDTAASELAGIPPRVYARRWWTLGVLCLTLTMVIVDETIVTVVLPLLVRDLDANATDLQWIVDAYVLAAAGLLVVAGALGDRFGRRLLWYLGLLGFAAASAWAAWSTSPGELVAARLLMGVAGACLMPSTLSLLSSVFPPAQRGSAIGIWSSVAGIGIILGPLVGGWLVAHFWWGSIFLVNVPLAVLALGLGVVFVPESRDPGEHPLDVAGAVTGTLGLCGVTYALIEGPKQGWASLPVLASFLGGGAAAAAFVLRERRAAAPILDPSLFRYPTFTVPVVGITLSFAAFASVGFVMSQLLQFARGESPLAVGLLFVALSVGWSGAAPFAGRLVRRYGPRRVVAGGFACVAVAGGLAAAIASSASLWHTGLVLVPVGIGMGLAITVATDLILGTVPPSKSGVAGAVNEVTRMVGTALGIAGFGGLLNGLYRTSAGPDAALTDDPGAFAAAATDVMWLCVALVALVAVHSWWGLRGHERWTGAVLTELSDEGA